MTSYKDRRKYTDGIKAIILDWDGTIVDFGAQAQVYAITELFSRHGVEVRASLIRSAMGVSQRALIESITEMDQVALLWEQVHGTYPTQKDIYNLYREYIPIQTSCLENFSEPIYGALEAVGALRNTGVRIATTSAYPTDMLRILSSEAARRGFEPESSICADQVASGRPQPWMCLKAAMELQLYPMEAMVKIGDTIPDVEEGLNAGIWTVGVARSGNELGLTEDELELLRDEEVNTRIIKARERLLRCGAHFVIDVLDELPQVVDEINRRLAEGEHPCS